MQGQLTTSIVLYGDFDSSNSQLWYDFYSYTIELLASVKLSPNYLGITGQSFKTGKISLLSKTQKKMFKALDDGEEIVSLALYSLPEDFKTAAFDYNVYVCRTKQLKQPHLVATFSNVLFELLDLNEVVSQLKRFVEFRSGEVFQLNSLESPQIYASKSNSITAFKSLRVIKALTIE